MTIDKLVLRNFQAHKATELEFCPGVNCLVGESDEGKTSIIRALYWLSQNKPSGGDFISDFSKRGECSASIEIDGQVVTRFKNKTKNEYRINDQEFKALGKSGVPDEVKDILQLEDLNFQNQMDSPFLLSNNGGEVARYLNDIVNLNVIDESLTKIKSKVNGTDRDIKTTESEIINSKAELSELDWLEPAEKELLKLEDDYHEFKNRESKQEYLIDILEDADDLVEKLEQYKDTAEQEKEIQLLLDTINEYRVDEIHLIELTVDLTDLKAIFRKIDSLALDEKEIKLTVDLSSLIDVYLTKEELLKGFKNILADIYQMEDKIGCIENDLEVLENEYKQEFPDVCPLCERAL